MNKTLSDEAVQMCKMFDCYRKNITEHVQCFHTKIKQARNTSRFVVRFASKMMYFLRFPTERNMLVKLAYFFALTPSYILCSGLIHI